MTKSQFFARIALFAALFVPVYFMLAALGTKSGLWSWQTGLGLLTITVGPIVLGVIALIGIVALVWVLLKPPRKGWWMALPAIIIPLAALVTMNGMRDRAGANPIHDVSTDPVNPPQFPQSVIALREKQELNPILEYDAVLGEVGPWGDSPFSDVAEETHASLIPKLYPDLEPIVSDASLHDALVAVQASMLEMGMLDVRSDVQNGRVEAVAETFWFGFKDDVIARIRQTGSGTVIDLRSVSRVGLSDLGANAARVTELREKIVERLSA